MAKRASASLRICSRAHTLDEISRAVGVDPTMVKRTGDARGPHHRWETNVWEYRVSGEASDLDACILKLIDSLAPHTEQIRKLSEIPGIDALIWSACYGPNPEISLSLSPRTLSGIAAMGASLDVSIYFTSD